MGKPDLFLDTCILLSQTYGNELDDNHGLTTAVTNNGHKLFTSLSVKLEGKVVLKRRRRYYLMMLDLIDHNNQMSKVDMNQYSPNDQRHLQKLHQLLSKYGAQKSQQYLRSAGQRFDQGFDEQVRKMYKILPRSNDKQLQSRLELTGLPMGDAQITTDS
jgi:hypothetical protein